MSKTYAFAVLEAWSLKSRCQQSHARSERSKEGAFPASSSLRGVPAAVGVLGLWQHTANLHLRVHVASLPVCLCLCFLIKNIK